MLNRIINSYLKEKEDYSTQPMAYEIAGIWEWRHIKDSCEHLTKAVERRDFKKANKILSNFASDKISQGLSLIGDSRCNYSRKEIEANYYTWKKLTLLPDRILQYPRKFGFKRVEVNEVLAIPSAFRFSYYAKRITDLTKGDVVEIGGGFGGVAYHLFRDFNFNRTYLNFDIPIASLMMKYFLMSIFPDKKFLFYGEDKLRRFRKYDIVIMPHYAIRELPKKCCDLVFNSHSLPEMGRESIKEYLKQIGRISRKYFLHFNHDYQTWFGNGKTTAGIDFNKLVDLSAPEYGVPDFKRIYRFFEPLMRQEKIDYFEYLYEARGY